MLPTASHRPILHRLVPVPHRGLRTAVQVVLGVAFLALLAQVRIVVGPVPITGQTLGVLLLAAAAGGRLGAATTLAYLGVGAAGLPVFTGGGAGLSALTGATAGYLVGFVVAAAVVGALAERGGVAGPARAAATMVVGNVVIYAFGVTWLAQLAPDLRTAFAWGVAPFLVGDALKIAVATALLPLAARAWRPR
ncbi:MAG: biotin transporter BioY [Trueperaceae bacterium]|nr:biotin transporter BioY [Trueperaceae bacterium]